MGAHTTSEGPASIEWAYHKIGKRVLGGDDDGGNGSKRPQRSEHVSSACCASIASSSADANACSKDHDDENRQGNRLGEDGHATVDARAQGPLACLAGLLLKSEQIVGRNESGV